MICELDPDSQHDKYSIESFPAPENVESLAIIYRHVG